MKICDKYPTKYDYNYFLDDLSLMCLMFMELFFKNIQIKSRNIQGYLNQKSNSRTFKIFGNLSIQGTAVIKCTSKGIDGSL